MQHLFGLSAPLQSKSEVTRHLPVARRGAGSRDLTKRRRSDAPASIRAAPDHLVQEVRAIPLNDEGHPFMKHGEAAAYG